MHGADPHKGTKNCQYHSDHDGLESTPKETQ